VRKKLVIFVHFKGFNISQKPKSSPLSYFAQKTSLNLVPYWYPIIVTCPVRSDSCSYISNIDIFMHYSVSEIATLILSMSLNFIISWKNDKWYNKRVLIWRFTLVLIKINYAQIGDQKGSFIQQTQIIMGLHIFLSLIHKK
jgi:hypothetical protein